MHLIEVMFMVKIQRSNLSALTVEGVREYMLK